MSEEPRERPNNSLADVSSEALRGADLSLIGELVAAARTDQAHAALEAASISALQAGTPREDLLKACDAARLVLRAQADGDLDVPSEDRVMDLMDRLTGWCHPDAHL